jgi:hypothetical protein
MLKNMTIQKVKERKARMEEEILEMVQAFEKDTGVFASHINFVREHESSDILEPEKTEKKRSVKSVEVNMDLDLIY